jgi:hypothetical protein
MELCILPLKTLFIYAGSAKPHSAVRYVVLNSGSCILKTHRMLTIFGRKKLTTERTAQIFSHHIVEVTEAGFPDVAGFINDSPEFVRNPNVQDHDYGKFLMVVIAGNYACLPQYFQEGQDKEIITACNRHLANVFDMTTEDFENTLKEYKDCMARANFPSKNVVSASAKVCSSNTASPNIKKSTSAR